MQKKDNICNSPPEANSLTNDIYMKPDLEVIRNKRVLVLGFYDRDNIGDENYKHSIKMIFPNSVFVSSDDLKSVPNGIDAVICGGGDIINDYFMRKLVIVLKGYNGPVYALSVGIPYHIGAWKYLDTFDHIFVRSEGDASIARRIVGDDMVDVIPDTAWLLRDHITVVEQHPKPDIALLQSRPKVCFCLAQPMFYHAPNILVDNFVSLISQVIQALDCEVYFASFNTFSANVEECDDIIHQKVFEKCQPLIQSHLHFLAEKDPIKMMLQFQEMDLIVGMRFHSIVFAAIAQVPFVALCVSTKLVKFLKDINADLFPCVSHLPVDESRIPQKLHVTEAFICIREQLERKTIANVTHILDKSQTLSEFVLERIAQKEQSRITCGSCRRRNCYADAFERAFQKVVHMLKQYMSLSEEEVINFLDGKLKISVNKETASTLARITCYALTGDCAAPYYWGMADQLYNKHDFVLTEAMKWVFHDMMENKAKHTPRLLIKENTLESLRKNRKVSVNMEYFPRETSEGLGMYHRSGWRYVVAGLMQLHQADGIIVDTYVDRTFHWGKESYYYDGLIPYRNPWIGFVHHTFDESQGENNCASMFKEPIFLESLKTCRCLIALSSYLAEQLKKQLEVLELEDVVRVAVLYHPTEFVDKKFTMERFVANNQKKVVQVGAWLRNPYAIYELPIPNDVKNNPFMIKKIHLKGKEMDNYFCPSGFLSQIQNPNKNRYVHGLIDQLYRFNRSVSMIEGLSNDEYDVLLSSNIVFLNLVDVSAANTVIECIVRDTPLFVNRHPALVEVLGEEYPGFYENYFDAAQMIISFDKVREVHNYMKHHVDKSKLRIETFMREFEEIVLGLL